MKLIEDKIDELKREKAAGVALINQLRAQLDETQITVLRIEGGIAVCQQLLKAEVAPEARSNGKVSESRAA